MDYLELYQRKLRRETSNSEISSLIDSLVILNSGIVINDVRNRWRHGESVNGGIIGTYSWNDYREYKQSVNPLANGNVDLYLHGDLAEGLFIRRQSKNLFQILSSDQKYNKIGKKYGYEEFGLRPDELNEFLEDLFNFALITILNKIWE